MSDTTADLAADYLVHLSQESGDPLTNLKLQKLLYYAQGWYLALFGKPLFDDRIEAWPHGPVVPRVYGRFKDCRWNPIAREVAAPDLPAEVKDHLQEVMQVIGVNTAYQLERVTHYEPPWRDARGNLPIDEPSNNEIGTESVKRYFSELLAESPNADQVG